MWSFTAEGGDYGKSILTEELDVKQSLLAIIAIVPLVGAGTVKNPKRPLYSNLEGITGFTAEISDDGRFALVEFQFTGPARR